jgi:uncharacterized RDD family membrane protein YckC
MTQQDETWPGTATDQQARTDEPTPLEQPTPLEPAPPPSPYLDATGSPQAYLAPPRPDQPRYGTPTAYRPSPRSFGGPQQPPGQQGYGQPGYPSQGYTGQDYTRQGYGRPVSPRGAFGAQARRDPAIAAPWERLVASILDWVIIFVVSVLAFLSPLEQIWREWQAIATRYPNLYSPAAQAAIGSISRDPATQHTLLYWFLGMFGIALAYYWVQHAAWGATIGKRALGTRVVAADRSRIGVRAAGLRAATFLVGPAVFLLLANPINYLGGLLWLADTGLPLFDSRARCLHDKLAGTIVIRQRWLDQQARSARPW